MAINFEYEEILSSLLSSNSASLLLTFLQDYMKDETQEFELNLYDQTDLTVSRSMFQNFCLNDREGVKEEFNTEVITMYTNPMERSIRSIMDITATKPKEIAMKNILKHFTSVKHEENLNAYGMLIKFKLNEEIPTTLTKDLIIKYQQVRQRKTIYYKNWKVDKSLRYTLPIPNKYNKEDFTPVNYEKMIKYTSLDIEIEHIGQHSAIMKDFAELMGSLFPKKVIIEDFIRSKYNYLTLPKVITLGKKKLEEDIRFRMEEFVWLYKTDGERVVLLFNGENAYIYNSKLFKRIDGNDKANDSNSPDDMRTTTLSIFDAEYYEEDGKGVVFVFDAMLVHNLDVHGLTYLERINEARNLLCSFPQGAIQIIVKEVNEINMPWLDLLEQVNSTRVIKSSTIIEYIKIDGIILQNKSAPYGDGKDFAYKVKPQYLNTIDFLAMYYPLEYKYILFVTSSYKIANSELKTITFHSKFYRIFFNNLNPMQQALAQSNPMVQAIFSSPYVENASFIDFNNIEARHLEPLFDEDKNEARHIIEQMKTNPQEFHHRVIECVYTECWIPLHVRTDKKYANKYVTAISNFDIIFNYFDRKSASSVPEPRYFDRGIKDTEVSLFFKFVNSNIRTYVYDKYVNPVCDKIRNVCLCDLACGRGADIPRIVENCVSNVFAIDADRDALVEYRERFSRRVQMKDDQRKVIGSSGAGGSSIGHILETAVIPRPNHFTLNIVNKKINENSIYEIEQEIMNRSEFSYFDVVVCNFAIHYLLYNIPDLIALVELLVKVMKKNGILILSYYNGDKILDNMDIYENLKHFKISILEEAERYSINESKHKGNIKGGAKTKPVSHNVHDLEYNYINWLKKYNSDKFLLNTFCTFFALMSKTSIYEIPIMVAERENLLKNNKKYDKPDNTSITLSFEQDKDFLTISDAQESLKIPSSLVKTLEVMHTGDNEDFISHLYTITKHYYHNPEYSVDANLLKDYITSFNAQLLLDTFNFSLIYEKLNQDFPGFYSVYENDQLFGAKYLKLDDTKIDSLVCVTNNKFLITHLLKVVPNLIVFTELKFSNKAFDFINTINVPLENVLLNKTVNKTRICIKSDNISFDKIWSPLYRFSNRTVERHGKVMGGAVPHGTAPHGAANGGAANGGAACGKPMLALMPLITIDHRHYREEPLVFDDVLKNIFEPSFIELHSETPLINIADKHISQYSRRNSLRDEEYTEVMTYCRLIAVKVYKKNDD